MKFKVYDDYSVHIMYETGDIVELIKDYNIGLGAIEGEWGVVELVDKKDKTKNHTGFTSCITIRTAGISTPKDSFQQCICHIPVWFIKPKGVDSAFLRQRLTH